MGLFVIIDDSERLEHRLALGEREQHEPLRDHPPAAFVREHEVDDRKVAGQPHVVTALQPNDRARGHAREFRQLGATQLQALAQPKQALADERLSELCRNRVATPPSVSDDPRRVASADFFDFLEHLQFRHICMMATLENA